MDSISILRSVEPDKVVAKSVRKQNVSCSAQSTGLPTLFDFSRVPVCSLEELFSTLLRLQSDPSSCVIRGDLIAGRPVEAIRRTSREGTNGPANFQSTARRWTMIDIDDLPLLGQFSDLNACQLDIVRYAVSFLPDEFKTAFCVYQWSASMGFKRDKVRLHLWFLLDQPVTDAEMKAWLRGSPVDLSLYSPVQLHFTANPILEEGIEDPIEERVGLYAPDGFVDRVQVPTDLAGRSTVATTPRRYCTATGSIDPQAIVRDPVTNLVLDGRELFLLLKSNDAVKELLQERTNKNDLPSQEEIAERTLALFSAEADLSDGKWTIVQAMAEAARRFSELEKGTYSFISRADVTVLEPTSQPFANLDLVSKEEAASRLDAALSLFFDRIDKAPRMALRITMGAGKTRGAIRHLQAWLAGQYGKRVEIYVPRHDLADQYIHDIGALYGGICAEVIHVHPRTGGAKGDLSVLCRRADYVRSLEQARVGVFQAACRSNSGEHCTFFDDCPYIDQFKNPQVWEDSHGNTIRVSVHSHLGLPRNPLQVDPDLVIIDEAFLSEIIDTTATISLADLKRNIVTERHPKLGKLIFDALEDGEPLLKVLREREVTAADFANVNLEHLLPNFAFSSDQMVAQKSGGDAGLYRAISTLLRLLTEEMAITPERDQAERVVFDPHSGAVRLSYLKEMDIPETAAVLLLDATADKTLLEQLLGPVAVERIDVRQRATVAQVFDRTGSNTYWDSNTASVTELISVANAWAEFGEKPLIVGHKALADRLQSDARLRPDVKVMHFGALRGSNAAKDCGVIFITGRNMPPSPEVDLKARALFWDSDEPLQHDEAGRLTAKDDRSSLLPTQLRGYIQSARNIRDQSGVRVPAFSDARIDALYAQYREAETMQALGRLRLVHGQYQKRVILLSNLPVEMPVDQLVSFDELVPDRLEIELLNRGNIPITDLGLQKMRPDLAPNRGQAVNLLSRSSLCNPRKAMRSLPELWQTMIVVATFRAGTTRKTKHQHLFVGQDMAGDGIAMAGRVPSLEDITRLLVHGDPQIGGTGWGEIDDLRIDFLHSSSTI